MSSTQALAADLTARMPTLLRGSLCVFGDVFGGRVDNVHTIVAARAVGDCLQIDFDGAETLQVWDPDGVVASEREFTIQRATRVRWEWFFYGREHTPEHRHYIQHERVGDDFVATTDATWAPRSFSPSTRSPAVELLDW